MTKSNHILPLLLLAFSATCGARAPENRSLTMYVGPTFNFARYKMGDLSKIEGYLTGVHANLLYDKCDRMYVDLDFAARWNAGFICGTEGVRSKIHEYRPNIDLGYNINFCSLPALTFTPLIGFGYYHLSNTLKPANTTSLYYNINVPVGLALLWNTNNRHIDVGVKAKYRIDVWTRLKEKTAELDTTDKLKLKRSHGVSVEVPINFSFDSCHRVDFHARVTPFFDWNKFGRTKGTNDNDVQINLPRLQQWYLGLNAEFGFSF